MPTGALSSSDRATRIRENKRRSRARHKEYVEDLERRWHESREAQLTATIEVQAAARKVAEENRRLRALLKSLGVDDTVVERWAAEEDEEAGGSKEGGTCAGKKGNCKKNSEGRQDAGALEAEEVPSVQAQLPESTIVSPSPPPPTSPGSCRGRSDDIFVPPCKILTRLKLDPSADPRDIPVEEDDRSADEGGVSCARAYKMLIPYATSEEKMDALAERLEEGCIKDGKGGCKVRNEVVWRALDDVCLE